MLVVNKIINIIFVELKKQKMRTSYIQYLFLILIMTNIFCNGLKTHEQGDTSFCKEYGFYLKTNKLNDSLLSLYFFRNKKDSIFMDLFFLNHNILKTYIEKGRNGDETLSDLIDVNDTVNVLVKWVNPNVLKIGKLQFEKDKNNSFDFIENLPKYKYFPLVNHDHYYYNLLDSISVNEIDVYDEPTSLSNHIKINVIESFSKQAPIIRTTPVYFDTNDIFYEIAFGATIDHDDENLKNIYYIKESDLKNIFRRER